MIVEYIRYTIGAERAQAFQDGYEAARAALDGSQHCLAYELSRGVEEPGHFTLRIEWDSLEGHEQGFRTSAEFASFFEAVRPFFDEIDEMKHYQPTRIASRKDRT
jgi:quinol monooxygenase YgiN